MAVPVSSGRDLRPLFEPASVAVVGASDDPVKWGNWLGQGALRGAHRRAVHLVNRRGGKVLGVPARRSLAELPEPPELVVLAVPAGVLDAAVGEALDAGARAIVAIAAAAGDDAALAARVRAAGATLVGPNCMGVLDSAADLQLVPAPLAAGPIGLISQSGNLALEIAMLAADVGLGLSRFVSLGNQADLEAAELVRAFAAHEPTRVIALYLEDFRDGRAFAAAARDAGKPVVLLSVPRTDATARALRSHTGALASDGTAIDAACRAAGIERVRTTDELVDVCQALVGAPLPRGRRVAVLSDGGGHGSIAAGLAHEAGLEVPRLGAALSERLRAGLPPAASVANPVDLAGAAERDLAVFERLAGELLRSGEVDAVLMSGYFGGYAEYGDESARRELAVARGLVALDGGPLIVQTMHPDGEAATALRAGGVPVYRATGRAVEVLARLADRAERRPGDVPVLPGPAEPVGGADYVAARELLAAAGVPFPAGRAVADAAEAAEAAAAIGFPVVLKALGILHKSDAGGVALGLGDATAVRAAAEDMAARLAPPGLWVEAMADDADGVELLAGVRWDERFGPVLLVGLGGVYAEVLRDVAAGLAPVGEAEADALLRSLRGAPLLLGARGRPAVDVAAACRAIAALSRIAAEHPEIAELEINPLRATPTGVLGLDARAVLR